MINSNMNEYIKILKIQNSKNSIKFLPTHKSLFEL